jgi:hypothetical protein
VATRHNGKRILSANANHGGAPLAMPPAQIAGHRSGIRESRRRAFIDAAKECRIDPDQMSAGDSIVLFIGARTLKSRNG